MLKTILHEPLSAPQIGCLGDTLRATGAPRQRTDIRRGPGSTRLQRVGAAAAALIVLWAVACESPQPPAACGPMSEVTLHTGETANVTACFDDPNGDMLSYSATSSDIGVAAATFAGTSVTVTAFAPGSASVTVTATDPGGLASQQSFQVTVPNRAPRPTGTIPPIAAFVGWGGGFDAAKAFTDPDGEALTYGATSSNTGVATVSVTASIVRFRAFAEGMTTLTITATDPGGLSATQEAPVSVTRGGPYRYREDFDTLESVVLWGDTNTHPALNSGVLELTNHTQSSRGGARRSTYPITSWTLDTSMGRKQTTGSRVGLEWRTGHQRYGKAEFVIGNLEDNNYTLQYFDVEDYRWHILVGASGNSTAINDGAGELTPIRLSFVDGLFKGVAGDTELFSIRFETDQVGYEIFSHVVLIGLVSHGTGKTALFDWIEVNGNVVGEGGFSGS